MVTNRPYREAIELPEALQELARCAGTQFDPAVVTALTHRADRTRPRKPPPSSPFLAHAGCSGRAPT